MSFNKQGNPFIIANHEYTSIIVDYDELQHFITDDKQIFLIPKSIKLKTQKLFNIVLNDMLKKH
jgi:hypothetical protein